MTLCLEGAMTRFRVEGGNPDIRIRAEWKKPSMGKPGRLLFDSGSLWRLYLDKQDYRFELRSPIFGEDPYAVAIFDPGFASGRILLSSSCFSPGQPLYPLQYPLDELLLVTLLTKGKGIHVHACGVIDGKGRGYLFAGNSGFGKTTMARLWNRDPGAQVLSDDRISVRKMTGEFRIYGTPWHGEGEFASPACAPLHGIFFLRHGRQNKLLPKTGSEAAALLFATLFPTFHDADGLAFTLEFCDSLIQAVPCRELQFVPDHKIVQFILTLSS